MSLAVFKVGGEIVTEKHRCTLEALADALKENPNAVLVHGGGPQSSLLMRQAGLTPTLIAGQRVTDSSALRCVAQGVGGEVNSQLVAALVGLGVHAMGLGVGCIRCARRPPVSLAAAGGASVDYGLVGGVTSVDVHFIELVLRTGMLPVLPCLGLSNSGVLLNVNGDTAARAVATSLQAEHLVLLTSTPGVLRDRNDPSTRIETLSAKEAADLIEQGVIEGGMVAKMEEAVRAVEAGIKSVHILGALSSGQLQAALSKPGSVGTSVIA